MTKDEHPNQWQGLTHDELLNVINNYRKTAKKYVSISEMNFYNIIEQALKEKNNG